jgi:hypothetical protein
VATLNADLQKDTTAITTATNNELIAYADYGSSITLASGETFTVDFDATNGALQIA